MWMQVCLQRLCKCTRCTVSIEKPGWSLCTHIFNFSTWNEGQNQGCNPAIAGSNAIFTAFCITTCFTVPAFNLIRETFCPKLFTISATEKTCLINQGQKVISTLLSCTWKAVNMRNFRFKHNLKIPELSWEIQSVFAEMIIMSYCFCRVRIQCIQLWYTYYVLEAYNWLVWVQGSWLAGLELFSVMC